MPRIQKELTGNDEIDRTTFKKIVDGMDEDSKDAWDAWVKEDQPLTEDLVHMLGKDWAQLQEIRQRSMLRARLTMFVFQAAVIFQGGSGGKAVSNEDREAVERALQAGKLDTTDGLQTAVGEIGKVLTKIYARTYIRKRSAHEGFNVTDAENLIMPLVEILNDEDEKNQLIQDVKKYQESAAAAKEFEQDYPNFTTSTTNLDNIRGLKR